MEEIRETNTDKALWRQAHARVSFKKHALIYLLVNGGLWAVWLIKSFNYPENEHAWPFWPTFGWGIGLGLHFVHAYQIMGPALFSAEKEYERLQERQKSRSVKMS